MPKDILIKKLNKNRYYDISFDTDGDFLLTEGFETAILMSMFCERRASASEVPNIESRRGWWGNKVGNIDNYEIGSKLWLLVQSRRDTNALNLIKSYITDGFQWMLEDNYIDSLKVDSMFIVDGISVNITMTRLNNIVFSNAYEIWNNTNLDNL